MTLIAIVSIQLIVTGLLFIMAINGKFHPAIPFYWIAAKYYFHKYNKLCFNGQLKDIEICIHTTYITETEDSARIGHFWSQGDKPIQIAISCFSGNWLETLLHEMVHYYQFQAFVATKTLYVYNTLHAKNLDHSETFNRILNQAKSDAGIK